MVLLGLRYETSVLVLLFVTLDYKTSHKGIFFFIEQSLSACIEKTYVCLWNWFIQFFEKKGLFIL